MSLAAIVVLSLSSCAGSRPAQLPAAASCIESLGGMVRITRRCLVPPTTLQTSPSLSWFNYGSYQRKVCETAQ